MNTHINKKALGLALSARNYQNCCDHYQLGSSQVLVGMRQSRIWWQSLQRPELVLLHQITGCYS